MAATVFNQAQLELLEMMHWVKSPEALADLTQEKLKSFETLHERT